MKEYSVLILEDDISTLRSILVLLEQIGEQRNLDIAVTVLATYIQVQEYVNKHPIISYDIVLLDRDCYLGGSYHVIDLQNFNKKNIVSISSVPEYNQQAKRMGIERVVLKDYNDLEGFASKVQKELDELLI